MTINTPDWVKHAVFYQIFPDRFARSSRMTHPRGIRLKPWGSPPAEQGYQGGDLLGIVDKLDYLQNLGVTALYLNPIFTSASNHRYHTFDYYSVDPLLGGNAALRELLEAAHARGMYVVLDGVFNHTGRGFWQFNHILENGGNSPYIDWFLVQDWPLRPYIHDDQNPPNYVAWANNAMLPKLNTDNPGVRDMIMDVARYWIDFGIDGWRLDVPNEIDDDAFWQEFREVVKTANPEAYIVGEIWDEAGRWLQGDQFDAVMNYRFTVPVINYCAAQTVRLDYEKPHYDLQPFTSSDFAQAIDHMHSLYTWQINEVQLNLLDSHDTARALWIMGADKSALRLAVLLQMTLPGAPCIYYGDEIGMSSADDPDCRAAFPWETEDTWDQELLAFYQRATALRHAYPVLRTGSFETWYADEYVYVFRRKLADEEMIVVFNTAVTPQTVTVTLPEDGAKKYRAVWPDGEDGVETAVSGYLTCIVPKRGVVLLHNT
ncbi:MAG: glycoside hydrolase family 13 protein [Anaerolineales bacterium]|nr:glycoside hydrolase family 13 protein [Anaerolineales bacterium]